MAAAWRRWRWRASDLSLQRFRHLSHTSATSPAALWCRSQERCPSAGDLVCFHLVVAATDVLTEILRLPAEERARLALELLRSLDGEPDPDANAAWDAELERRGAEVDAGTAETLTLDEYRAHVRARRAARAGR